MMIFANPRRNKRHDVYAAWLALPLAGALALGAYAAGTATSPASRAAATAASVPASEPAKVLEPKEVVERFLTGIVSADQKAVFDNLFFSSDDVRREAEAILGEALAQQQLDATLVAAYEKPDAGDPSPEAIAQARIDEVKKGVAAAQPTQKDDTAELKLDSHATIYLVRKEGVWKVDFDKTQRANEGPADNAAIANAAARLAIYKDVTALVRAGKFNSAKQANDEVKKRIGALPMPAATGPAAPTAAEDTIRANRAIADLSNLKAAVMTFEIDNSRFPSEAEGLAALVIMPAGLQQTWNKQIDALPKDPWGRDYVYHFSRTAGGQDFEIISAGPDGEIGTDDDIVARGR